MAVVENFKLAFVQLTCGSEVWLDDKCEQEQLGAKIAVKCNTFKLNLTKVIKIV